MAESPRRLLLADPTPASRTLLEPLVTNEGWEILSVESSFQVLRTVRDANVDIVLINPDLPGSGVTGADVAKTLKGATQFRHLPVFFLLHGGRPAPKGIAVDGSIEVDRWEPARIFHTIKQALGLAEPAPPPAASLEAPVRPTSESLLGPLTNLVERLAGRLESRLSQLLEEQEARFRHEMSERMRAVSQEFVATEGPEAVRQEIRDQVGKVVEQGVIEVAREVVPEVAERLIAEEIARLRRAYGVEGGG
jgi:CheY-like chemotaxis protein